MKIYHVIISIGGQEIMQHAPYHESPQKANILTKAVLRAKELWDLSNRQLAGILGISDASITRMREQGRLIQPGSKEWELAVLFLRAFRSLDAIMGGHIENEKRWLHAQNHMLREAPITLMQTITGLHSTVQYLDAIRGH